MVMKEQPQSPCSVTLESLFRVRTMEVIWAHGQWPNSVKMERASVAFKQESIILDFLGKILVTLE